MQQDSIKQNKDKGLMALFVKIRTSLAEPRIQDIDLNSDELLHVQRQMLSEKAMLRSVFDEFYHTCHKLDEKYLQGDGKRVELGAGVSRLKELYPDIITTDIKSGDHLDMVVDAQNMPFDDETVRSLYAINCFHHMPDPSQFLRELERVLQPGGGCIFIEPYYGPLASVAFKRLFDSETFDKNQESWKGEDMSVMTGANQALSYIVFERDKQKFAELFPHLEIVYRKTLSSTIRYFLSGGLNFKQLLPDSFIPIVKGIEALLSPIESLFAMQYVMVLRKKGTKQEN